MLKIGSRSFDPRAEMSGRNKQSEVVLPITWQHMLLEQQRNAVHAPTAPGVYQTKVHGRQEDKDYQFI